MRIVTLFRVGVVVAGLLAASRVTTAQVVPPIVKATLGNGISYFLFSSDACRKTQLLYPPATLVGPRVAGPIRRLYFRYSDNGSGPTFTNLVLTLGQTPNTAFVPTTSFYPNQDTVFNHATHTIPYGRLGEWFSFDLDRAFTYDPAQTLIVGVTWTTGTGVGFGTSGEDTSPGTRGFGKKLYSATPTATTGDATSVLWQHFGFAQGLVGLPETVAAAAGLRLWPNPATDELTVTADPTAGAPVQLTVRDVVGRTVRHYASTAAELRTGRVLRLHGVPAGIYTLTVEQAAWQQTQRLIVR